MADLTPECLAQIRSYLSMDGCLYLSKPTAIELLNEIDRLRAVIRETHTPCAEWQASVYNPLRHAPTCKLYEIEP